MTQVSITSEPGLEASESTEAAYPPIRAQAAELIRRHILATRGRRVGLALVFLWVLNIFDLVVTILAARAGGFQEANPLARKLLASPPHLVTYKLLLLTSASTIFLVYRRHRISEIGVWGTCMVYLALAHICQLYHG